MDLERDQRLLNRLICMALTKVPPCLESGVLRVQAQTSMPMRLRQRVVALLQWAQTKCIGSLQVSSSSCRPEQDVKLLLCTTFDEGEENPQGQGRREPSEDKDNDVSCSCERATLTQVFHPMMPGERGTEPGESVTNEARERSGGLACRPTLAFSANFGDVSDMEPRSSVNQNCQQVETAVEWISCSMTGLRRPFRGVRRVMVVPYLRRPASRFRGTWRPRAIILTRFSCMAHPREGIFRAGRQT